MKSTLSVLISGALIMGYLTAATFFLRFWKDTSDRLFAFFAAAFLVLALQRLILALTVDMQGNTVWLYGLRLVAFVVILVAIADKNRAGAG